MASLKELRNRITSVTATQKITKAMQMVAAAKLRRAQERAEAGRPYAERMGAVLANLAGSFEGRADAPRLLAGTGRSDVHLLVVATAERGLCGGFNTSIARLARVRALALKGEGKVVKILCVGRKGEAVLRRQFAAEIVELISFVEEKNVGYTHAAQVGKRVLEMFSAGEFDVCSLFFSRFQSVIVQIPTELQLIPAEFESTEEDADADLAAYEYEPEEDEILEELLPRNLNTQIYRAILENAASEQGARMSAMDSATRNAGDMIDRLTLSYNRTRQAQITKELIEIISGAEAI